MFEKKELNFDELEMVGGGAGRYQTGKYYADLYLKLYQNKIGGKILGPYDTEQEAKTAAETYVRTSSESYTQVTIKIKFYNNDCAWIYGVSYDYKY